VIAFVTPERQRNRETMDTVVVIIVLITLLVLFGGAAWFFVRETGVENAKLWLTSPKQVRQLVTPFRDTMSGAGAETGRDATEPMPQGQPGHSMPGMMLDDRRLRELAEELRGELTRATGTARAFDARLTRIEEDLVQAKSLPETLDKRVMDVDEQARQRVRDVDAALRKRYSKLRDEIRTVRKAESPYSAKRSDALSEIYGRLARTEAALAGVVNPMLLPGEPLRVPEALFDDTSQWENWADVGERAYEFGEAFNANRLLLEPDLAISIESFISTLRETLTDTIYPVVRHAAATPAQHAQLRAGLERVVEAIGPLRRSLEDAYRVTSAALISDADDDDDEVEFHA
jgi:hypothetical protein